MSTMLIDRQGAVATLTLNRPERGNAVDAATMEALLSALGELGQEEGLRLLLVRGAGADFCRGREAAPAAARPDAATLQRELAKITQVNAHLGQLPAITLAVVQGRALGFGCGLATQCDLTLAAEDARFGFPEIKGGVPPTIVLSYITRWVPRKKALELILTGKEISATEAERLGMVNRVVPAQELEAEVVRWQELLLAQEPQALRLCKAFLREAETMDRRQAANYATYYLATFLSRERG